MPQNYGFLNNLANGANSMLNTYLTVSNLKHNQQMQELASGVQKDDDGNLTYAPWKQAQINLMQQQAQRQQGLLDPNSDTYKKEQGLDQSVLKWAGIPNAANISPYDAENNPLLRGMIQAKGMQMRYGPMVDEKYAGLGYQQHHNAVDRVVTDKPTQNLLNGYQSMKNALVEFQNNPSNESLETLQNAMRMNAGSGNRSGVAERATQYAKNFGLDVSRAKEYLSGNFQNVDTQNPQMVNQIIGVINGELEQKREQASQQIRKVSSAYNGVYNNPYTSQYRPDFDNAVAGQYAEFDMDPYGRSTFNLGKFQPKRPNAPPHAQGRPQPQQGLLGRIWGAITDKSQAGENDPDYQRYLELKAKAGGG